MSTSTSPSSSEQAWLDRVAHDLRGPLSPIRIAVQMLRSGSLSADGSPQLLELIDRQLDELLELIEELGDRISVERNRFQCILQPVDLRTVVEGIVVKLGRHIAALGITLCTSLPEHPVEVACDARRIAQLLAHLIRKMATARVDAEQVRIELHSDPTPRLVLHIADGQHGIAYALNLINGDADAHAPLATAVLRRIVELHQLAITLWHDESGIRIEIAFV